MRWWTPELERLARIERGGGAWLANLPLVAATMLFYSAGVAAVHAENYNRLLTLFRLHGESITEPGEVPLIRMLAPNPTMIKLTSAQNYATVSPLVAEALHLRPEVVQDAWQQLEILRLATLLMGHRQFDTEVGTYTAANRRAAATAAHDATAERTAHAARNKALDGLSGCCGAGGLHVRAIERVFQPGDDYQWGSDIAERLAAQVGRDQNRHPLVRGLETDAARIEIALRAVSRAVGRAAKAHPAYQVAGAGPAEIWLDR